MKTKRLLTMLCVLCLTVGLFAVTASAAESGTCGENLTWTLDDEGTLTISGQGEIPDMEVGDAPWYYDNVVKVVIEPGVTGIGTGAFGDGKNIASVEIPNTVTRIGNNAFQYCRALTSVELPDSVTSIGDYAFYQCDNLSSFVTGDGVTTIGRGAFNYCDRLQSVELGKAVITIADSAFYGCYQLKQIVIPASVTNIARNAFDECYSQEGWDTEADRRFCEVYYGGTREAFDALNIALWYTDERVHYGCTDVENHWEYREFPATCTNGAYYANGCDCGYSTDRWDYVSEPLGHDNQVVVTPPTCTERGYTSEICSRCSYTRKIKYVDEMGHALVDDICTRCGTVGSTVIESGTCGPRVTWVFTADGKLTISGQGTMYYYDDYMDDDGEGSWSYAPWRHLPVRYVVVEDGVTSVGSAAFNRLSKIVDIRIADSVTTIGHHAFYGTYRLKTIVLPASITSVGNAIFGFYEEDVDSTAVAITDVYFGGTEEAFTALNLKYFGDWRCRTHYEITDPESHTWEHVTVAPGCYEQGYTSHTCPCGHVYRDSYTPKLEHNYEATVIAPDCEMMGYTTHTCEFCGDTYNDDYVDELGHLPEFSEILEQPGCTSVGQSLYVCQRCGMEEVHIVASLGHELVDDAAVVPTCTQDGLTEGSHCSRCGWTCVKQTVIPANGHHFVLAMNVDPTCTEEGFEVYTCSVCWDANVSYRETIPATGHDYQDNVCKTCGHKNITAPSIKVSGIDSTGKPKLSWNKVEGAVKYEVYRATSKNGTYKRLTTTSKTSTTNNSAVAGKTYYYYVVAIDANGNKSEQSKIVSRTCDLAQTTVKLSTVASTGKIKVSWDKVEGATKYEVYRATSKNGTYTRITTTSGTSITNSKTNAGKTYYYKVRAICGVDAAKAAYSEVKSITCDLAQPKVSISLSSKKPKVSWKKVDGAVSYKVYRATSKNGTYSLVKTTTSLNYKDTAAKSGKTYYYKVVAVCTKTAGNSAYSGIVSIKSK